MKKHALFFTCPSTKAMQNTTTIKERLEMKEQQKPGPVQNPPKTIAVFEGVQRNESKTGIPTNTCADWEVHFAGSVGVRDALIQCRACFQKTRASKTPTHIHTTTTTTIVIRKGKVLHTAAGSIDWKKTTDDGASAGAGRC